jgi:predicted nuclease of predicted toxin-antitoxin system
MIKILVDENVSFKVSVKLKLSFPGSIHTSDIMLSKSSDREIWNFAKSSGYTLLTKDIDFVYMSNLLGCPPKVIRLVCGNRPTEYIIETILRSMNLIKNFNEDPGLCLFEIG